jgi:hypothetical protein
VLVAGNESSCWIHAAFESLGRGIRGSRDCPGSSGSLPQSEHITKLYRSYLDDEQRHHPRHRGKLPHQITYLVRSLQRQETVLLASSLSLLEALPLGPLRAADSPGSALTRGELLLLPAAQISFEQPSSWSIRFRAGSCCWRIAPTVAL